MFFFLFHPSLEELSSSLISLSIFLSAFFTFSFKGRLENISIFYFYSSSCFYWILLIFLFTCLMTLLHSLSISCFSLRILSICCSWASNRNFVSYKFSFSIWNYSVSCLFAFFNSLMSKILLSISIFYFLTSSSKASLKDYDFFNSWL